MATKIRRSLFIGLGGTGMRTLLYLKKLFIETYGEVPGMIGFLGVDTDRGAYSKDLELKNVSTMGTFENSEVYVEGENREQKVRLEKNEQIQITVEHPRDLYMRRKESYACIPSQNIFALKALTNGAGQVRSNGRFALIANSDMVMEKVTSALNNVARADAIGDKYELIDNKTDIYLIFSLAGGTGSGCFLDMAYLIRHCVKDNCKLAGFGVLPEIFKAELSDGVDRVRPNAYGAVKDLDWLMGRDWSDTPIKLTSQDGKTWSTNFAPFDACIFVDNKNKNHDVYNKTEQIEEMIALTLITSVGELSTANVSVLDNLAVDTVGGSYDVEGKKAWACGMGVCEVLICCNDLRRIYSHMVTYQLVNQLLNRDNNISTEVRHWIDSPSVKIREHDADDVIDFILDNEVVPMSGIDKEDYSNAENAVTTYLLAQCPDKNEVEKRLNNLITRVSDELRIKVIECLNRKVGMGVGSTSDLLNGIKEQVTIYLNEMEMEKANFKKQELNIDSTIKASCKDLKEKASNFLKIGVDEVKDEICNVATNLAVVKKEIIRRDKAIIFFTDLLEKIKSYTERVKLIHDRLVLVKENSAKEIAKIRQEIDRNTETFQINLTSIVERSLIVNPNEILISDFINSIKEGNKIFDFSELEPSSISIRFNQYAFNLPTAKAYGNKDINDILKDLQNMGDFDKLVKKIVDKSSPLLPYDFLGYTNKKPMTNYYIGVNRFEDSLLKKDDYFKNNVDEVGNVQFSNIGMNDRIIVFSQMNPIPPFAIDSISGVCKSEYEDPKQNICFHFDTDIWEEMKRKGFSIEPSKDDNGLDLWVKGFIFGLIKREDDEYQYLDEENGDSLLDYWTPLSKDRDDAFKEFEDIKGCIEEQFTKKMHNIMQTQGLPYIQDLYTKAKTRYVEDFSCSEYTKKELSARRKELSGIAELVSKEIDYVRKQLTV